MPQLRPKPSRDIIRILEKNGFKILFDPKGSHARFGKITDNGYHATTVQINRREIPVFVLLKIIRQTGKPIDEFY